MNLVTILEWAMTSTMTQTIPKRTPRITTALVLMVSWITMANLHAGQPAQLRNSLNMLTPCPTSVLILLLEMVYWYLTKVKIKGIIAASIYLYQFLKCRWYDLQQILHLWEYSIWPEIAWQVLFLSWQVGQCQIIGAKVHSIHATNFGVES